MVLGDTTITTIFRGLRHKERPKKENIGQCSGEKYIRKKNKVNMCDPYLYSMQRILYGIENTYLEFLDIFLRKEYLIG